MSFVSKFKDATIGFSGYPRLMRTEEKTGFRYLALLLLLVLAVSALIDTVNMRGMMANAQQALRVAPNFGLQEGRLRFDGPMPYRVEEDGVVMIVDTTGQTGPDILRGARPSSFLATETKLYQVTWTGAVQESDLSRLPISLSKEDVLRLMASMHLVVPFVYIVIYGFQLAFKTLNALILGALGVAYATRTGHKVPFTIGYKLAFYAMTMSILLQWIVPGFTTLSPLGATIWWGLAGLYTVMGMKAYLEAEPTDGLPD